MIDYKSRAFIFDMDGTLVDNMKVHTAAWRILIEENGLEFDERKFLIETAGQTNREIIPAIFGNIPDDHITELALRKETLYREAFLPHRKPIDGVVEFLEEASRLGVKTAVATASSPPNMKFILDGLDLRRYFDTVTTAVDVKRGKPDPEMFLLSAERLGVEPQHCMVFEDAIGGFEAARRAGMKAIGITTVNDAQTILQAEAVVEAHADFTQLNVHRVVEKYLS